MNCSYNEAEIIINKIIEDIRDRQGIGDEWDQIDRKIQQEIKSSWIGIILYA